MAEGKSWTDAILQTIPPRKGAKPKEANDTAEGNLNNSSELRNCTQQEDEELEKNTSLVVTNPKENS